jgi:hypothetical protein
MVFFNGGMGFQLGPYHTPHSCMVEVEVVVVCGGDCGCAGGIREDGIQAKPSRSIFRPLKSAVGTRRTSMQTCLARASLTTQ